MPKGVYKRTKPDWKIGKSAWNKGLKMPQCSGEKHHLWKGNNVGYIALHAWITRKLGRPNQCEVCGTTKAKRFEWANISLEYKRALEDWKRMCVSCHRKEGFRKGEYISWIKGTHAQTNTGKTHFKKGHTPWFILQNLPNPLFIARKI